MGDARGLQECACTGSSHPSSTNRVSTPSQNDYGSLMLNYFSAPAFVAGGSSSYPTHPQQRDRDDYDRNYNDRRGYGNLDSNGIVAAPALNTQSEPDYHSIEEAEGAFMKMLKRHNVQSDWTWEW